MQELTNDEFRDSFQAHFVEAERRLAENGNYPKQLRRLKRAHAVAQDVEDDVFESGDLQARSGGTDKPIRD